jgi:dipeptidase E
MKNTNDMPIVYPLKFKTLGRLSFNTNAHYLNPAGGAAHIGETRETSTKEFPVFNKTLVLGVHCG